MESKCKLGCLDEIPRVIVPKSVGSKKCRELAVKKTFKGVFSLRLGWGYYLMVELVVLGCAV